MGAYGDLPAGKDEYIATIENGHSQKPLRLRLREPLIALMIAFLSKLGMCPRTYCPAHQGVQMLPVNVPVRPYPEESAAERPEPSSKL